MDNQNTKTGVNMAGKREVYTYDEAVEKAMEERLANADNKAKMRTMKELIARLYDKIRDAMENKGLTRDDIYDVMLDDEQKSQISKQTFMTYYHSVRKQRQIDAAREAREQARQKAAEKAAVKAEAEVDDKHDGKAGKNVNKKEVETKSDINESVNETNEIDDDDDLEYQSSSINVAKLKGGK